ncbi:MAG: shikimate dehydrogenase [Proteobacteria bacterium]|nr:shikimate dehydrogenase [Pseudomonadota bacterium]
MIRAGVIGWPIEHSRSPLIHGYWLKKYGIEGSYTRIAVEPQNVKRFFAGLAASGLAGCNVTLPHKEAAFRAADVIEPSARGVEAANTIWLEGGRLHAANTDTFGFMRHLELSAPGWRERERPAMVLGAGGAARGIVYGLLDAGVGEVRVANRTLARAEEIAKFFGAKVKPVAWAEAEMASADCGLLVNATSLGMAKTGPLEFDVSKLPVDATVADIVYVPLETALLARARGRGLAVVDGLGMLLHQAVPGFAKWFGVTPEVTPELRGILVRDIEGL